MENIINVKIPNTLIGLGAINSIVELANKHPHSKVLIITDQGIVNAGILDTVTRPFKEADHQFDVYSDCPSNPSISSIEEAAVMVENGHYDLLVGVGGGSVMDFTKVVSMLADSDNLTIKELIDGKIPESAVNMILIPTTAGTGSEWSTTAMVTDEKSGNQKWGITNDMVMPTAVIIDPELTKKMPQIVTANTGMDALVHAIESYSSNPANVISDMFSLKALDLIHKSIGLAYSKGNQKNEARYNMSIGASLAMFGASVSGVGIAHFLGHPLEKRAHIEHGVSCTLMLPYSMDFNLIACPDRYAKIAETMGESIVGCSPLNAGAKAVKAFQALSKSLGMPQTLSDIGVKKSQIPEMAKETVDSYGPLIKMWNARDLTIDEAEAIYTKAYNGL